ncbi:MAG: TadE/TadG family type IV pilus assembly protein [Pseudomonadota bacterium]
MNWMLKKLRLRRLAACEAGVSSIEFAFIAPVLIMFMLGSLTMFDAMRATRQMSTAAQVVSDLVTRLDTISDEQRDAVFLAAEALLGRYGESEETNFVITSVANLLHDNSDDLYVVWSEAKEEGTELTNDDLDAFSFPQIPNGEAVILIQTEMEYQPVAVGFGLPTELKFEDIAIRRPRFVAEVCYRVSEDEETCSSDLEYD